MFSVFEIFADVGKRSAFGAPDNWEVNGKLSWPKTRKMNVLRKGRATPQDDWECTTNYKVLARNLTSFKACLAKERELELHSDSESLEEAKKKKALKRLHPVNESSADSNLYDLSSDFETITAKRKDIALESNVAATVLNETDSAHENTASPSKAIIHSIEIIEAASKSDDSTETNIEPAVDDLSTDFILDLSDIGIENLSFEMDVAPAERNPSIVNKGFLLNTGVAPIPSDQANHLTNHDFMMYIKQNLQAFSDSICSRMDSFENKLACLDKKVDSLASKQDILEQKLNSSEQKIDSELKLLAGIHVKLDILPKTPANKKVIPAVDDVPLPFPTPSKSEEDLRKMVLTIKKDINVAETLERKLISFGGGDSRKCIYEILKSLFADDVLINYTWKGTADKASFENLPKIHALMKKCVRMHFPDYTDDQYKKDVQEHLKHACTRIGRRYF